MSVGDRILSDFPFFAQEILRIRAKDGNVIPFRLNKAQRYLHTAIEQQLKEVGKVRMLGLKGRQQGFSTYVQGRFSRHILSGRGLRAFILTHEQEATNNLFEIAERFWNEAPFDPGIDENNAKEIYFSDNDCGYKVGTAGNKATGRSSTLQLCHGSEVAHWPNASAHFSGVIQAVPDAPGTEIILESTANGVGGLFHQLCLDAMAGVGDYRIVFIPWFWQEEYRRDAKGFIPTKDEQSLAKLHKLTNEQLAWRRSKIYELKSEALFHQEYPCTPEEAFIFSGHPVFDQIKVREAMAECFKPKYRAEIDSTGNIIKREDGPLRVWKDPEPGMRYVIGADVAEGLEHGDFSCSAVLEAVSGTQVAQWHGHIDPDRFGEINHLLGKRYNRALVGIERNNHGLTTLTTLRNKGYPNLYAQQDIERRSEGYETKKFGWLTTSKSKHKIIDQMAAELRDDELRVFDVETIKEMGGFVNHEDGSQGAKPGGFDDRVMARAIAGEMLLTLPRRRGAGQPTE